MRLTKRGPRAARVREANRRLRVAVLGDFASAPRCLSQMMNGADWCDCQCVEAVDGRSIRKLARCDVAILVDGGNRGRGTGASPQRMQDFDLLRRLRIGVLVLTASESEHSAGGVGTVCLPLESQVEKVHGALVALASLRPVIRNVDKELNRLHRLNKGLHHYFEAMDQDLRLASRLQRDFLPRELPQLGPIRFTTLFRPANWVSGDIFDVFRLDERHVGFYLFDAIGHGVAAGLLTMYIRHAIRTKRIGGKSYELIPPGEVIAALNDQLAAQQLPDSQFLTGWYGKLDFESLRLDYSVAGHPPPLLIGPDGEMSELHGEGCLLGLFPEQHFATKSITLRPGQRVMLYSDGLESILIARRSSLPAFPTLQPGIAELLRLPAEQTIKTLEDRLDNAPGSLSEADDVTIVVVDVTT